MSEKWIKGVIFDLDGTLYTLGWMKTRMSLSLLGTLGLLRRLSGARAVIRKKTFGSREQLLEEMFKELARRAGVSHEAARAWYEERFLREFVRILGTKNALRRDGLEELLRLLKERGVRTAVVSDFGSVEPRIRALRLDPNLFDELVAAEDYGVLKPSPEPMIALAKKWALTPETVVVVGDRADLDQECARRAGMGFIGVTEKVDNNTQSEFDSWKAASSKLEAETGIWST